MKLQKIKYALLCLALACGSAHAERADSDKPVHLEADQVSIDDNTQTSTFEGNVHLSQGTMSISGDKIVVVQNQDGFKHGTATGHPASFRQKRDGLDEYVEGYGDRIEYDTRNETVDFYGQARITRGQNEVRGEHITYNAKTEVFQVHSAPGQEAATTAGGRVRAIIQPKSKGTAPAEPLPIKPAETLVQPEDRR
jgi:lipopolysaccharide export system protein LptA